jgi:hypothetical protein
MIKVEGDAMPRRKTLSGHGSLSWGTGQIGIVAPVAPAPEPVEVKRHGTLELWVLDQRYEVSVIPIDPGNPSRVQYMVHKTGGDSYTVAVDELGVPHCQCGSFHFRHEGSSTTCKHVKACETAGLLDLYWRNV